MAGTIATIPRFQFFDINGDPLSLGTVETYITGTSTPSPTWKDAALSVSNGNIIALDSEGGCIIWLSNLIVYRFIIKDLNGVIQPNGTIDNIIGGAGTVITSFPVSNVILTNSDLGKIIYASGTFTQTFNACASLGANWTIGYYNIGTGTITLDPNGGELIDGAATLVLGPKEGVVISCTGTALNTSGSQSNKLIAQTFTSFTTTGTAPNLVLTPTTPITAYAAKQRFAIVFNVNSTGADNINVSSLGNKLLKQYTGFGAKIPALFYANQVANIEYDGTDFVLLNPLNRPSVPVRQTALGGPVDSLGNTVLGGSTGATTVVTTAISSTVPLVVTCAAGFDASGQIDRLGVSTANLTWTGLNTNGTVPLFIECDILGNLTTVTGTVNLLTNYQRGGTYSVVNGQYTFNINEGVMKLGNGATATQVFRIQVGEVTVAGNVVTAITWYAYRGKFASTGNAVAAATAYTKSHFLGVLPSLINMYLTNTTADANYQIGDRISFSSVEDSPGFWVVTLWSNKLSVGFGFGAAPRVADKTTPGNPAVALTLANWTADYAVDRGW